MNYLEKRLQTLKKRADEIDKELEDIAEKNAKCDSEDELRDLGDTLAELEAEKAELEAELKEVEAQIEALRPKEEKPEEEPKKEPEGEEIIIKPERKPFLVFEKRGENKMNLEELQKRAEAFKSTGTRKISTKEMKLNKRAITVASGTIATPTEVNPYINPTFNQVSSIVDLVDVENCEGMGAYKVAYEVQIGSAAQQTEGSAISPESNPVYAFKTIQPATYAILSSITNQVLKQSPLDYEGKVVDSAEKALRVKAANIITSAIVSDSLLAKPSALNISAIDEHTLRNIAFNYGSDETIYQEAWLFLNKKDLIAFGDVRSDTTLQAVYEITPDTNNPNTGVIKDGGLSVRYCLNPNLTALADASANGVSLLYGQPENFKLALFGDYEIKVSEDFQFSANMLTIRGTVDLGGAVVKKDGFVAVTKAA